MIHGRRWAVQATHNIVFSLAFALMGGTPSMTETWLQASADHSQSATFRHHMTPKQDPHRIKPQLCTQSTFTDREENPDGFNCEEPPRITGKPCILHALHGEPCEECHQPLTLSLRGGMGRQMTTADKVYKKRKDIIEEDQHAAKQLKEEEEELAEDVRGLSYEERLRVAFDGKDPEEIKRERRHQPK
jgi:hypothetical protein